MVSCMIGAMEGWDVATSEDIHINMEGKMVTLLEEIDPDYYKDFIYIYSHKKCTYTES